MVVKSGRLQVVKQIDGVEVTIAVLRRGDVLNSRNVFLENETMKVKIRSLSPATILILSLADLN